MSCFRPPFSLDQVTPVRAQFLYCFAVGAWLALQCACKDIPPRHCQHRDCMPKVSMLRRCYAVFMFLQGAIAADLISVGNVRKNGQTVGIDRTADLMGLPGNAFAQHATGKKQ